MSKNTRISRQIRIRPLSSFQCRNCRNATVNHDHIRGIGGGSVFPHFLYPIVEFLENAVLRNFVDRGLNLPITRLERSRFAGDACAWVGLAVEVMI